MSTSALALNSVISIIDGFHSGSKKERNAEIVKRHLGLDGSGGCSMEIAGKPHNLTRESVRQILNKYKDALIVHKSAFEALKKAAAILEKIAPVSAESAEAILAEAGLIEPGFKVEGLINASNFLTVRKGGNELSIVKEKSFWSDTSSRYVVTTKFEDLPKLTYSRALKETSHNGASSVIHLSADIGAGKEIRELFVRDLVNSIPGVQWLDSEQNWFYFPEKGRNRLIARLNKIFSVYHEVKFKNVKEGIRRSINKHNDEISRRLPDAVLKAIFISEGLKADSDIVYGNKSSGHTDLDIGMLEFEKKIIDTIIANGEETINELKLENAIVTDLKEKFAFSMALNYSPLIHRLRRGQYSLIGKC